jgi:hypothetical protein
MSEPFLTQLPITYIDSIEFENVDSIFHVTMVNHEHKLTIKLINIIAFNFSKSLHSDEDWIDIIEITHEHRTLEQHDLRHYAFPVKDINELSQFHVVTIHRNTAMEVICKDIEVQN